jgi:glycosyltransferase involved in cell wall biosynthesis
MPDPSEPAQSPSAGRRLRILMLGRGVVPIAVGCGGAELAMYQLGRSLALAGHEVTLVADVVGAEFPGTTGLTFVALSGRLTQMAARLPASFFGWLVRHLVGNLVGFHRARQLLRRETFDLIHAHANLAAYLLARSSGIPVLYTEHDSTPWSCHYRRLHERLIRRAVYRLVNVPAFRRATAVATTCASLRRDVITRWHIAPTSVHTILNGADFDVFNPDRCDRTTPAPFERYCLFVGALTPRKAPDLLLRALTEAPQTNCVFAGAGPMRTRLEHLARELGVENRVAFLGDVAPSQLAPLYTGADLLVLPSFSETTSLVAFEAMACGTPVLSSRVAGLTDLVHDWNTGFLVKPGDVGQLAIAIRFLTADPEALARMGKRAQRRVRKRFLWPKVAAAYLTLYNSLLPPVEPVSVPEPELLVEPEPEPEPAMAAA